MYEVSWHVTRDRSNEVIQRIEDKIDSAMQDGAERILTRAQGVVRVRSGETRDSGRVEQVGPMHWRVVFGGAAIYLEFGTAHHPAYPFIVPSAQEESAGTFQAVNYAVGGRGAIQIGSDYLKQSIGTEGGFA